MKILKEGSCLKDRIDGETCVIVAAHDMDYFEIKGLDREAKHTGRNLLVDKRSIESRYIF